VETFAVHGGRLGQARRRFPGAAEPWIDLSTGINPVPYPARPATSAARGRLPDPEETGAVETAAARAFGVGADAVLATAGAEAAIRLLASCLGARHVGILEPAYGGHGEAWRAVGATVTGFALGDLREAAERFDAVVVVNPNNPDGAILPGDALVDLAGRLGARDGWLIVDEAFVEASSAPGVAASVGSHWAAERLIALRSFGKFYGLPGLRLGFVTAHSDLIARLRLRLGEWPVGADAIAAGLQAYADEVWATKTRRRLAEEAARLDALLVRSGMEVVGGTSLFRLAAADNAQNRFMRLAEAGILTRPFDYAPHWLRFGLPHPDHWPRLEATLQESAS
jgi:cobalamin biosynthetic protein CobC